MRSPTIVYPSRSDNYGDKNMYVFYSIKPVIDRFMVTDFKDSIATIKPMYKSTVANMLAIVAGCFEEKSNVSSELFKVYENETMLTAIRLVLDNATVMVTRDNANNLLLNYGQKSANKKCEQEVAENATNCERLAENVGWLAWTKREIFPS